MSIQRIVVGKDDAGHHLADVLRRRLRLRRSDVYRLVRQRYVRLNNTPCTDPERRLHPGQRIEIHAPRRLLSAATPKGAAGTQPHGQPKGRRTKPEPILYLDGEIVVVDKPPGVTTMRHKHEAAEFGSRAQRFLPVTLADQLTGMLAAALHGRPPKVRPVHRLDKETSGLVVFALTPAAERELGRQFREHSIERTYQAVVRGRSSSGRIESFLVRDRGDGRRGSTTDPAAGHRAVTHVRVLEELGEFTLVECRLETGRTHQVRIHLGEAGTPMCGERVYDRPPHGPPLPDGSGAPRLALHAARLGLRQPATGKFLRWTSPLPDDLAGLVRRLRQRAQEEPSPRRSRDTPE
jgi:23S rRNA pseudouridine1911/1915/1917 synthase